MASLLQRSEAGLMGKPNFHGGWLPAFCLSIRGSLSIYMFYYKSSHLWAPNLDQDFTVPLSPSFPTCWCFPSLRPWIVQQTLQRPAMRWASTAVARVAEPYCWRQRGLVFRCCQVSLLEGIQCSTYTGKQIYIVYNLYGYLYRCWVVVMTVSHRVRFAFHTWFLPWLFAGQSVPRCLGQL